MKHLRKLNVSLKGLVDIYNLLFLRIYEKYLGFYVVMY